jgi:hypothetical protein
MLFFFNNDFRYSISDFSTLNCLQEDTMVYVLIICGIIIAYFIGKAIYKKLEK